MKINIAKSSGFCFGVKRAIEISEKISDKEENVCVLGDIVHNSFVVNNLSKRGIKKISKISPTKKKSTLIIRAHGASKKTFEKAKKCGWKVVDATCPKVKDIYKIAKRLEANNSIIIIGDSGHDEVKGIAGQLKKKPITIESPQKIPIKKLSTIKKAIVVTQSTQSIENITKIMKKLLKIIPNIKLYNTTCRTTVIKQEEIKNLPLQNDLILIIGSKTSANTKRLYEISKKLNKNTHWIESEKNINKKWFSKKIANVGIMAGASTPDYITRNVISRLKKL